MFAKTGKFLKEVRAEGNKVTWPTREELIGSTIVTVVTSVLVSVFIFIIDQILTYGFTQVFGG
ncbi:MAG: preprotein translocase subunit SecE [candidate division Zixibacteria bacterium]|nr:preprotein translocase subunit SecE [candidate division Zixibacteria bacterium]